MYTKYNKTIGDKCKPGINKVRYMYTKYNKVVLHVHQRQSVIIGDK